jgi:hypothetical protein
MNGEGECHTTHNIPKLKKSCHSAGTNIKINLWLDDEIPFPYRLDRLKRRGGDIPLTCVNKTEIKWKCRRYTNLSN